jgi:hypothetical protein
MALRSPPLAAILLSALAGCVGIIDGANGANGGTADAGASATPGADGGGGDLSPPPSEVSTVNPCTAAPDTPGPQQVRRLSAGELDRTGVDLFKDESVPRPTFFNDPSVLGFKVDANALLIPDSTAAQQVLLYSEAVATWVDGRRQNVLPCTTRDSACARQFVRSFGKRAFRAPLDDAQASKYDALFAAQPSFEDGVHIVVRAMLVSPYFLFRQELGDPDPGDPDLFHLTPYEIASNLSYLVTGSMPDDQLMAAADAGQLATPAQLDAQVTRLLADRRAQDAFMRFVDGWTGIDRVLSTVKDQAVYGRLDDALRRSMYAETRSLFLEVFSGQGGLAELFLADHTFLDQNLAGFYGLGGTGRITIDPGQRDRGLLAHASLLTAFGTANSSSPVQRGKLIRTRFMCETLPPPPGGLATAISPPSGQPQTTRQRFEEHEKNEPCASCHKLMDPVGFAFEGYDGIGQRRSSENGLPIDTSGRVASQSGGADVPLAGLPDLATYLAESAQAKRCLVRYWSYYAFASVSWAQDGCTQDAIYDDAAAHGFSLESVMRAIVHAPHFTTRRKAS